MRVSGGFAVGFGTAYARGCTSGHAITGLADRQAASLVAVDFSAGGPLATWLILRALLKGSWLAGLAFGFVLTLTRAEVISWFRIQEMFRLELFHLM